jgi:DNA-directed RNA polymerase specialized sigma24 family protein
MAFHSRWKSNSLVPGQQQLKEAAVTDVTLDQALPVVRNLAGRKANAFVRRCRLAIDEREDVESQLVLIFITRWPKFDGEKASVRTFASRLMDKELTSILRYRLSQSRETRELPVPDACPTSESVHQFLIDLERTMAPLPDVVRKTASALFWFSAVDAARVVGCSRQMIGRRKHQIREALLAAGIRSNYFVGRGARP